MIIYPLKQYNPITGSESWLNPAPFIYDHELARSTENEIEKRAIKLAMEMVKNGEVR